MVVSTCETWARDRCGRPGGAGAERCVPGEAARKARRREPGPTACASVVPSVSLSVLWGDDVPCVRIVPCSCS